MRKLITLFALLLCCMVASAQKIDEMKVDEFTKDTIKTTSWEIFYQSFTYTNHFRLVKINGTKILELKFMLSNAIFSVDKKDVLYLKLENDSIISFNPARYIVTERGAGAIGLNGSGTYGADIDYIPGSYSYFNTLKNVDVVKIRFNTSSGYYEFEINKKNSAKIKKAFTIIDEPYTPKSTVYQSF